MQGHFTRDALNLQTYNFFCMFAIHLTTTVRCAHVTWHIWNTPECFFSSLALGLIMFGSKNDVLSSVWLISSSLHVCLHSSTFSWPVCVVIVMLFLQYLFMLTILVFCTFTVFLCISGNRDEVKRFPCISKKPFPFKNCILLSVPAQSKNDPNSLILKTFHTCNWS